MSNYDLTCQVFYLKDTSVSSVEVTTSLWISTFSSSVYKIILILYLGVVPPRTRWCSQLLLHTDRSKCRPLSSWMWVEVCSDSLTQPLSRIYSAWTTMLQEDWGIPWQLSEMAQTWTFPLYMVNFDYLSRKIVLGVIICISNWCGGGVHL